MFEDLTLFAMAKKKMDWLARRQEVLSENVANANTPKYQSKDLAPLSFKEAVAAAPQVQAVVTNPMHVSPPIEPSRFEKVTERHPDESKPNGNSVLLEEQMEKIGDVKGRTAVIVDDMIDTAGT